MYTSIYTYIYMHVRVFFAFGLFTFPVYRTLIARHFPQRRRPKRPCHPCRCSKVLVTGMRSGEISSSPHVCASLWLPILLFLSLPLSFSFALSLFVPPSRSLPPPCASDRSASMDPKGVGCREYAASACFPDLLVDFFVLHSRSFACPTLLHALMTSTPLRMSRLFLKLVGSRSFWRSTVGAYLLICMPCRSESPYRP